MGAVTNFGSLLSSPSYRTNPTRIELLSEALFNKLPHSSLASQQNLAVQTFQKITQAEVFNLPFCATSRQWNLSATGVSMLAATECIIHSYHVHNGRSDTHRAKMQTLAAIPPHHY